MIIADHEVRGPTEPSGPGTTLHHPELIPAQTFVITSSRNIDIRHGRNVWNGEYNNQRRRLLKDILGLQHPFIMVSSQILQVLI